MKNYRFVLALLLIVFLAACNDKVGEEKKNTNSTSNQKQGAQHFVVANNYSGQGYKNGVHQKQDGRSNMFYFLRREADSDKDFNVGDTLVFAKTGKAIVQKIALSKPNQNGLISVFVTIDKDIDPIGDGYPNKIYLGK